MTWLWLLAGVSVTFLFGWVIGNLQGKMSLAVELERLRYEIGTLRGNLHAALADVDNLRGPPASHDDSVSVLRALTDDPDAPEGVSTPDDIGA